MKYSIDKKDYGLIVKLINDFTFRDHDVFFEIVDYVKKNKPKVIAFDIKDCDFIDSAALGMLVIISDEIIEYGGKKFIVNLTKQTSNILYSSRFDYLYDICDKAMTENDIDMYVKKKYKPETIEIKEKVEIKKPSKLPELIMNKDNCVKVNGKMYKVIKQEELDLNLDI